MHFRKDMAWLVVIVTGAAVAGRLWVHPVPPPAPVSHPKSVATGQAWADWSQVFPVAFPRKHATDLAMERSFTICGVSAGMSKDEVLKHLCPPQHPSNFMTIDIW